MRKECIIALVAAVLALGSCSVAAIISDRPIRLRDFRELNGKVIAFSTYTACRVYEKTGFLVDNVALIEQSHLFPFRDWDLPLGGGKVVFGTVREGVLLKWVGEWHTPEGEVYPTLSNLAQTYYLDETERTRRFLEAVVQGPEWWYKEIIIIWDYAERHTGTHLPSLIRDWSQYSRYKYKEVFLWPRLSFPIMLEETGEDIVKSYSEWLCRTLGVSTLADAWGHPIRLEWREGFLVASSAGADGRWGTADDLIAKRKAELPQP